MKRFSILMAVLISVGTALAQDKVESIFGAHPGTRDASITALVVDAATGKVVDRHQPNLVLAPASCTKLIATSTALDLHGPDFRYTTTLLTDGTLQDGVLEGNLYIQGAGDPSLGSHYVGKEAFLSDWVEALRGQGIRAIRGRVVADLSAFAQTDITQPAWQWEDMGNYYAPGIFALAYKDNTLRIHFRSVEAGSPAEVDHTEPAYPGIRWVNSVRCADINYDDAYCNGLPDENTRYLTGRIPAGRGTFSIRGDIPNPGLLLAQDLTEALRAADVAVSLEADYTYQSATGTTLYTHRSEPLSKLVERVNIVSDNLYAEQIFRTLPLLEHPDQPSTISAAVSLEKEHWKSKGVDLSTANIHDGCGLSASNAISARQFVDLLTYMRTSPAYDAFYVSLPVSGQSGTLKSLLKGTPLEGRVHAKSGTISHVKSYAGYMQLPDNRTLIFCIIVNNASCRSREITPLMEQYLLSVSGLKK